VPEWEVPLQPVEPLQFERLARQGAWLAAKLQLQWVLLLQGVSAEGLALDLETLSMAEWAVASVVLLAHPWAVLLLALRLAFASVDVSVVLSARQWAAW
jgi:hypothetical protein